LLDPRSTLLRSQYYAIVKERLAPKQS